MIDRKTFVAVNRTMGGIETFKLRHGRGQIPLLDNEQRRGRGYYLAEAFLTALVEEFRLAYPNISLTMVAEIVSSARSNLREKWPEIVRASNPKSGTVLIGRAVVNEGIVTFVGTHKEFCDAHDEVVGLIAISASSTLAVFHDRCRREKVDLPEDLDLWAEVLADIFGDGQ